MWVPNIENVIFLWCQHFFLWGQNLFGDWWSGVFRSGGLVACRFGCLGNWRSDDIGVGRSGGLVVGGFGGLGSDGLRVWWPLDWLSEGVVVWGSVVWWSGSLEV